MDMDVASIPDSTHGRYLPVELLYEEIIPLVTEKKDLAKLCLLSRAMHHMVFRELYKDLKLSSNSLSQRGWYSLVVKRPAFACMVLSLEIDFPEKWPGTEIVNKLLRCLINLKT